MALLRMEWLPRVLVKASDCGLERHRCLLSLRPNLHFMFVLVKLFTQSFCSSLGLYWCSFYIWIMDYNSRLFKLRWSCRLGAWVWYVGLLSVLITQWLRIINSTLNADRKCSTDPFYSTFMIRQFWISQRT